LLVSHPQKITHQPDLPTQIRDAPTDKNILLFVAEADGLLGYIMGYVHPAFYANGLIAWVEELYVVPETRGAGIGRA